MARLGYESLAPEIAHTTLLLSIRASTCISQSGDKLKRRCGRRTKSSRAPLSLLVLLLNTFHLVLSNIQVTIIKHRGDGRLSGDKSLVASTYLLTGLLTPSLR